MVDIVACPVCGTEVSLTDTHCPKCNAEFAPGVMDEPLDTAVTETRAESRGQREFSLSKETVRPVTQAALLSITYGIGYLSLIVANYISNGGTVNLNYEQLMILIGGVTLIVAFVSAAAMGRIGRTAQASRTSLALIAAFILLIPPLVLVFKW